MPSQCRYKVRHLPSHLDDILGSNYFSKVTKTIAAKEMFPWNWKVLNVSNQLRHVQLVWEPLSPKMFRLRGCVSARNGASRFIVVVVVLIVRDHSSSVHAP